MGFSRIPSVNDGHSQVASPVVQELAVLGPTSVASYHTVLRAQSKSGTRLNSKIRIYRVRRNSLRNIFKGERI